MAYKIVDNPDGCVHPNKRGERTCSDCYYSQVDEQNCWTGGKDCLEGPVPRSQVRVQLELWGVEMRGTYGRLTMNG